MGLFSKEYTCQYQDLCRDLNLVTPLPTEERVRLLSLRTISRRKIFQSTRNQRSCLLVEIRSLPRNHPLRGPTGTSQNHVQQIKNLRWFLPFLKVSSRRA